MAKFSESKSCSVLFSQTFTVGARSLTVVVPRTRGRCHVQARGYWTPDRPLSLTEAELEQLAAAREEIRSVSARRTGRKVRVWISNAPPLAKEQP